MITSLRGASNYIYDSYISLQNAQTGVFPTPRFKPPKMAAQVLFTLPILFATTSTPSGSIVCTLPAPGVYLLTWTSPPDNRLLTGFCEALLLALDIIEFSHPTGVVVTTSGIEKFYSNGLDLKHAVETKGYWQNSLYKLWKRILTYVMIYYAAADLFQLTNENQISYANSSLDKWACICGWLHDCDVPRLSSLQPHAWLPLSQRVGIWRTIKGAHVLDFP